MELLKRTHSPLAESAWKVIDEEAKRVLRAGLTARRVVDIAGPLGPETGAVSLGRLQISESQPVSGLRYGIHRVLPLIELRASFELNIWELDNVARGALDVDLEPVTRAARALVEFEERAVYEGFADAHISGLRDASPHEKIPLGSEHGDITRAIARGLGSLHRATIGGPYSLVLGPRQYESLVATCGQCRPYDHVAKLLGGPILTSDFIDDGGFLVSTRGGDFQLVLGQDASIGWESTPTPATVQLFLMESFTFRVIDPRAVLVLAA